MQKYDVPQYLLPFLTDSGSLTKKLKQMTGSAVVKVLSGMMTSPDWWSQYYLNLNCDKLFQREIIMTSGNFSCWYARSYIPASTWYVNATFFDQLSKKNLGDILFDNQQIQRIHSHYFPIGKSDIPYYWPPEEVISGCNELWLKLSLFSLNNQSSFYLAELFLPELSTCLQQVGQPIGE